jgi:hypothetical protein
VTPCNGRFDAVYSSRWLLTIQENMQSPFFQSRVIQVAGLPEMFITNNQTTHCRNPDDHNINLYDCLYYSGLIV